MIRALFITNNYNYPVKEVRVFFLGKIGNVSAILNSIIYLFTLQELAQKPLEIARGL